MGDCLIKSWGGVTATRKTIYLQPWAYNNSATQNWPRADGTEAFYKLTFDKPTFVYYILTDNDTFQTDGSTWTYGQGLKIYIKKTDLSGADTTVTSYTTTVTDCTGGGVEFCAVDPGSSTNKWKEFTGAFFKAGESIWVQTTNPNFSTRPYSCLGNFIISYRQFGHRTIKTS